MEHLQTREVQLLLLDLLVRFDEVCRGHCIRYTLDAGTLLGAVRHKGFIPWDDDVDLLVPRPDYDRLLSHSEWLPDGLRFASRKLDGYLYPFAKLYDTGWRMQEQALDGVVVEYLWLDIFPLDAVPDEERKARAFMRAQGRRMRRANRSYQNYEAITVPGLKLTAKRVLYPLYRKIFPAETQYRRMDEAARTVPYGSTARVGNVVWKPSWNPPFHFMSTSEFDHLVELEFEGHSFMAIPGWDDLLSRYYGDYMRPPREDKRVTHGARVWRNNAL